MSKTEDIGYALKLLNAAFAEGRISFDDYERQDGRLRRRQAEIRAFLARGKTGGTKTEPPVSGGTVLEPPVKRRVVFGTAVSLAVPYQDRQEPASPRLPLPRRPNQPEMPRRQGILRRRATAYAGLVPPAIAKTFTVGQLAVLSIVADMHMAGGRSTLSYAETADRAGCSKTWVKATIKLAKAAGLVSIEHRPRPGRKSDTNIVRIIENDWISWLKVRSERQEKGRQAASIGGSGVSPSSNDQDYRRAFATKERANSAYRQSFAPSESLPLAQRGAGGGP